MLEDSIRFYCVVEGFLRSVFIDPNWIGGVFDFLLFLGQGETGLLIGFEVDEEQYFSILDVNLIPSWGFLLGCFFLVDFLLIQFLAASDVEDNDVNLDKSLWQGGRCSTARY